MVASNRFGPKILPAKHLFFTRTYGGSKRIWTETNGHLFNQSGNFQFHITDRSGSKKAFK
jgi:hypothetical protein